MNHQIILSLQPEQGNSTRTNRMHISIIGAGAAGCFAAINLKRMMPSAKVTVFERNNRPLAKVAITGGGRCNLTNSFENVKSCASVYPRGERLMKRLLKEFSHKDAYKWFEREGVKLVTQDDNCVFPASQDAMEIVNTLTRLMRVCGVELNVFHKVTHIGRNTDGTFCISYADESIAKTNTDVVLLTSGGSPKAEGLNMLKDLGIETASPVPSLFSLCIRDNRITELTGTVVEDATVALVGTKNKATGPLLITHWGMSGPAILKLSSYAARELHEKGYKATLAVNWLGETTAQETMELIKEMALKNPHKQLVSVYPQQLNSRLWLHLLHKCGLDAGSRWNGLTQKGINRLANTLTNDQYSVDGKNRFKEEFVTCGGVSLSNINLNTLECKNCPGLYFAGEVLDVDAITGGFNLQAAWTMGFVAAKAISLRPCHDNPVS